MAPEIGKGSQFKSFGKLLDVSPSNYYLAFSRWNQLSVFKTLKEITDLKSLVRQAEEPEKLELFIDLSIDHDEGYPLYQAVSATKMALSSAEEAEFRFAPLGKAGEKTVTRAAFEGWIADDITRMEEALDQVLETTNTSADSIDKVFLTGGTSFRPGRAQHLPPKFSQDRIETGGELVSIAHGLALIGERDDIDAVGGVKVYPVPDRGREWSSGCGETPPETRGIC